ncbi:hypothetical protein, partial [Streptomyces monomycini]|uniref:hypothetical protein n=1 Tax=Streptomyces monomycini TaxID=371720 RepID=UPI001AD81B97
THARRPARRHPEPGLPPRTLPLISTLTGQTATHHDLAHPDYWTDHARNTVRFHHALTTLHEHGTTAYL